MITLPPTLYVIYLRDCWFWFVDSTLRCLFPLWLPLPTHTHFVPTHTTHTPHLTTPLRSLLILITLFYRSCSLLRFGYSDLILPVLWFIYLYVDFAVDSLFDLLLIWCCCYCTFVFALHGWVWLWLVPHIAPICVLVHCLGTFSVYWLIGGVVDSDSGFLIVVIVVLIWLLIYCCWLVDSWLHFCTHTHILRIFARLTFVDWFIWNPVDCCWLIGPWFS